VGKNLLIEVGLNCMNLTSIICIQCKVDESVISILRNCTKLETFLLVRCYDDFSRASDAFDLEAPVITKVKNVSIQNLWEERNPLQRRLDSTVACIVTNSTIVFEQHARCRLYSADVEKLWGIA